MLRLGGKLRGDPRMLIVLRAAIFVVLGAQCGQAQAEDLSICYREDAPPFSYVDETNNPAGYSFDLCQSVAESIGSQNPVLVPVTVENRFEVLKSGACDLLCGATTVTIKRREVMDFTLITFVTDTALLFPKSMISSGTAQVDQMVVGYLENTTTKENIKAGRIFGGDELQLEFEPFENHKLGAQALTDGSIDAYVADRDILNSMVADYPALGETHQVSRRGLSYEPYALAMRAGEGALKLKVDRALAKMFRDGRALDYVRKHIPSRGREEILEALFEIQSIPE